VIDRFLVGQLPAFLIALSLAGGVLALWLTPREEEPQIVVPMADVWIEAPGLPVEEVERQISTRLEKLLAQIDGVETVYSMSLHGRSIVTVRFFVGEDREDSLLEIYSKLESNRDLVPPSVSCGKPIEIDDVPILIATLYSDRPQQVDDFALRRIAEEIEIQLQAVPQTNRVQVFGGRPRAMRVVLRTEALAARQTSPLEVAWALGVSNVRARGGSFDRIDRSFLVDSGEFIRGGETLDGVVVNVVDGLPVLLGDVAEIEDGPDEPASYGWIGFGPADARSAEAAVSGDGFLLPAVHVAVAKSADRTRWTSRAASKRSSPNSRPATCPPACTCASPATSARQQTTR
jgi:multidrug efflux pump subunit AcrB